jgi:ankyrin repeat protein
MHEDELRAECRAKLALIIDGGHLLRCPTRTKAFGFIKTVMRNHIRSLVQKFAFSQKRTGVEILPGRSTHTRGGGGGRTKPTRISLNDGDYALHVGFSDPSFASMEFIEELEFQLTPEERLVLALLVAGGNEDAEPRTRATATRIREKARAVAVGLSSGSAGGASTLTDAGNTEARTMNTNKVRSAIKAGDTKALEEMLNEGLKADAVMKQEWTLLHLAAKAGRANVVRLLLERGAKVDAQTEIRQTALDVALAGDKSEVVELLKKHGGRMGMELSLHSAVLAGNLKWVKKHLNAGADINGKHRGELPLCIALARRRWDIASSLLKKRPDVNKRQDDHNMALHEAAHAGAEIPLLKALVDLGADVNAVGCWGLTPLCWAARGGHEDTVRFLIQNGADVGYRATDGTGPVSEAVHERHLDLARFLIDSGAKCSLHHAVQCGHLEEARRLLSGGASVQEENDRWGGSPMAVAIWNDSVEMVQLLLEFGANPNEQEPIRQGTEGPWGGDTPLHDAVHKGSVKMVKLLLSRGADPDIQNAERLSPLELAKRRDQTHLARLMEAQIDRTLMGESVDQLYTIGKVAELLSVEEAFVTKLLNEGKLRQVKLDANMTRIPASSLRKYIAKLVK